MTREAKFLFQTLVFILLLAAVVSWAAPDLSPISDITNRNTIMENTSAETKGFYSFKMKSVDGKDVDFSQYKGKKVLVVNTASECGYTKQYADLQKLHETYGNKVIVLGFPANNFGGQEPGSNEDIAAFCQKNFGVTFPLFEKISVVGDDRAPLYTWLEQNSPNKDKPSWNFCKYLINEQGKVVAFFPSKVNPMGEELIAAIK
ncbi:glutathione peroxidase [Pontibacter sp. SGAir0037]|nr:glutathione peroxidase [Pontibacter sp. SGAir0037]